MYPKLNKKDQNEKLFGIVPAVLQQFHFDDYNDYLDAMSEGFIIVLKARERYYRNQLSKRASVETYIYVSVRNEMVRFKKRIYKLKERFKSGYFNEYPLVKLKEELLICPNEERLGDTIQQRYSSICCFLTNRQRQILTLHLEKLTSIEIAKRLSITCQSVKLTLRYIRRLIKGWNENAEDN